MMRRVLITGGSRGIGAAIADAYRRAGHDVLTPARGELDLADLASVDAWTHRHGAAPIDVLVNNAGENRINEIEALSLADWERILTINLTSAFRLVQAIAPGMAARGWGRIVNIASIYGFLARPGRAAYAASKAGLMSLTRVAALEYGDRGVLANAVCPGFVATEMTTQNNSAEKILELAQQTALKRLAEPEEIARLVVWLGSEQNTYLTGQAIVVDGGFSIQ